VYFDVFWVNWVKTNNSIVLFNEFGGVLGLENERFCVLGIFSPAPASASDETCEASKHTIKSKK
jgi:hypothetical protein